MMVGDTYPNASNTWDLGLSNRTWKDFYLVGTGYLGEARIAGLAGL